MSERIDPISYYDEQAMSFAMQASDKKANHFEYEENMPSLLELSNPSSGNILDFGCGAGNFTAMLVREDRVIEGSDASPKLLSIARSQHPDINFISSNSVGDVASDKSYSLIIAKLVFHYIVDLNVVLGNLNSKLDDGGKLLFSVPHPDKTQSHFTSPVDEAVYVDEVGSFGLTLPMVHRSTEKLTSILDETGFSLDKTVTVYDNNKPKRINTLATKTVS